MNLHINQDSKSVLTKERGSKKSKKLRIGATQQKVLLLLLGGVTLGLARSPRQYFSVIREISAEWSRINRNTLNKSIRALYESKLVETRDNRDGTFTLVLSRNGKKHALRYNLDTISIKKQSRWDGRWRIVMFDVPEGVKHMREQLRFHFKRMGFREFQKSVFVHPYPCQDEVEYVMEFYGARRYVRFILATEIDNALEFKKRFDLQ